MRGGRRSASLDLDGRDGLAAGADHVLHAADDRVEAVVVDRGDVTRAEPAVLRERLGRCVGVVEVAVEEQRARAPGARRSPASRRTRHECCGTPHAPGLRVDVLVARAGTPPGLRRSVEHPPYRAGHALAGSRAAARAGWPTSRSRRSATTRVATRPSGRARRARGCGATPRGSR